VLAAGGVRPDGAGLHAGGAVESRLDPVPAGLFKHLISSVTDRDCPKVKLLFNLFGDDFFLYHLMLPPFVESISFCRVLSIHPAFGYKRFFPGKSVPGFEPIKKPEKTPPMWLWQFWDENYFNQEQFLIRS
jgi:hypothetical protein